MASMLWPELPAACGPLSSLFYPLVYVAALPRLRQLYARRRIPLAVARATLADLEWWMRQQHRAGGTWGLPRPGVARLSHHRPALFAGAASVRVVPLSPAVSHPAPPEHRPGDRPGQRRRPFSARRPVRKRRRHTARLPHLDRAIPAAGRPAHRPSGGSACPRACQPVELDAAQWHIALEAGDPVLSVHIPATGRMDHAACTDAFGRALRFFRRHFPDHPFRAFTCLSWLMDPQLADCLPPRANLVSFLNAITRCRWSARDRPGPTTASSARQPRIGLPRRGTRCCAG